MLIAKFTEWRRWHGAIFCRMTQLTLKGDKWLIAMHARTRSRKKDKPRTNSFALANSKEHCGFESGRRQKLPNSGCEYQKKKRSTWLISPCYWKTSSIIWKDEPFWRTQFHHKFSNKSIPFWLFLVAKTGICEILNFPKRLQLGENLVSSNFFWSRHACTHTQNAYWCSNAVTFAIHATGDGPIDLSPNASSHESDTTLSCLFESHLKLQLSLVSTKHEREEKWLVDTTKGKSALEREENLDRCDRARWQKNSRFISRILEMLKEASFLGFSDRAQKENDKIFGSPTHSTCHVWSQFEKSADPPTSSPLMSRDVINGSPLRKKKKNTFWLLCGYDGRCGPSKHASRLIRWCWIRGNSFGHHSHRNLRVWGADNMPVWGHLDFYRKQETPSDPNGQSSATWTHKFWWRRVSGPNPFFLMIQHDWISLETCVWPVPHQ
jgi:hypothetical protein